MCHKCWMFPNVTWIIVTHLMAQGYDARLARTQSEFDPGWHRWAIFVKVGVSELEPASITSCLLSRISIWSALLHPPDAPPPTKTGLVLYASIQQRVIVVPPWWQKKPVYISSPNSHWRQTSFNPRPRGKVQIGRGRFVSSSHWTELAQTPSRRSHPGEPGHISKVMNQDNVNWIRLNVW